MPKPTQTTGKGYIRRLQESRTFKGVSLMLAMNLLVELIHPTISLALTEGPSQPEVQSFEPIGTTQMVDLFTGDFNYNIPLFNLPGPNGGYPVNLAYHAGVSMDDEASWVGLGWNINPGALVRNMRGLPDEFKSVLHTSKGEYGNGEKYEKGDAERGHDFIRTKNDQKESWTIGASFGKKLEIFGGDVFADESSLSASLHFNNYRGLGFSVGLSTNGGSSSPLGLGVSLDSENGLGITPTMNISRLRKKSKRDFFVSLSFDGDMSLGYSMSKKGGNTVTKNARRYKKSKQIGSSLSFSRNNFVPSIANKVNSFSLTAGLSVDGASNGFFGGSLDNKSIGINFSIQDFNDEDKSGKYRPIIGYAKNGDFQSSYTHDFVRQNEGQVVNTTPLLPVSYYGYDSYVSSGQGLNGYFRGRRNDIGKVHDPLLHNNTWGIALDVEVTKYEDVTIGPPLVYPPFTIPSTTNHFGLGGSVSFGWDSQGAWDQYNALSFDFKTPEPDSIKENLYYQAHGEQTILHPDALNHMNGTSLALVQFNEENEPQRRILTSATENAHIKEERQVAARDRVVRNTLIHSLKNSEVANLGEFNVGYYNFNSSLDLSQNPTTYFNYHSKRASREVKIKEKVSGGFDSETVNIGEHNAGFKVLNEDGSYYVYGLPAYNKGQVQNLFSVKPDHAGFDPNNTDVVDIDVDLSGDEKEVEYKKTGTHKFIDKTLTSPFAHSYMLTSVQGADYVDVTNNGPSDDDLGYWVKFDYVKYADDYKWRAPYTGANYSNGASYTRQDDKGSYQYGEKELWYVGRMETKSHIAIFEMSERKDMVEANGEFANVPNLDGKTGLKIDKIKVYEKKAFESAQNNQNVSIDDITALQTIHFEYDYSLCKGVPNNNGDPAIYPETSNEGGKLTLKKVWFTSVDSDRGKLTPYKFDYTSVDVDLPNGDEFEEGGVHNLVNPNFQRNSYDPWGSYRPYMEYIPLGDANPNDPNDPQPQYLAGYSNHSNFPYTNQTSQGWKHKWMTNSHYVNDEETVENEKVTKEVNGLVASTWSLRKIKLPSGGEISIEYESDDYSYVQHKTANQLFRVVKFGDFSSSNEIYNGDSSEDFYDENSSDDENRRRIYFKLEKPIPINTYSNIETAELIYNQYVEPMMSDEKGDKNLYFKSRMRLTYNANNEVYDYVRGYLPLESDLENNQGTSTAYNYGVLSDATLASNSDLTHLVDYNGTVSHYTIGYVTVRATEKKKKNEYFNKFHPMALSAWTYMQTNAQELLNPSSGFNSNGTTPTSTGDVLGYFSNILNAIPATASAFGFIRNYCKDKNFARFVDLQNTGIRLASPDKIKYGGGHRVKQISITDNWDLDDPSGNSRTYGQVYDYTTKEIDEEGNETTISSGVAQYEPQAGGDENALKYPIHFVGRDKTFTSNNLFAEGPVNEALFPGAMVGYRKVSVRTLNTDKQLKAFEENLSNERGRTGGVTEHEFYTGKDFPTRVEYSELHPENNTKAVLNLPIPIPFIGSIKRNFYHGSQAFKIELNDMHGKPKSVKSFEINNYGINKAPITEMSYEYQTTPVTYQGESVLALNSTVDIIPNNGSNEATESRLMGVETDLFTDQRENKSFWNSVGLDFNADIIPAIGPIPSFWPSYSNHKTLFRTYVTNKVVHRSGILKKSKSRDLQTVNETEILAYDEKAGTPLLTKVKNEFGDDFYSYNIPAYYHYDRMGHAYQNINYVFEAEVNGGEIASQTGDGRGDANLEVPVTGTMLDDLVRGDELLIIGGAVSNLYKKGYFLGFSYNGGVPYAQIQLLNVIGDGTANYKFKVIRSGRRNHYGTMAANYLTKGELVASNSQGVGGHAVSVPVIDKDVLSATASLFKDDWTTTGSASLDFDGTTDNPFLTGNSGIFRPYKSYTYVGSRESSASMTDNITSDPALYEDGVMNNVSMFTWELGNYEEYESNWEWVNEVTRFSPDAYELENVNRLGIHSSALYGYDNSLTIAVGGNASVHELGVYDFETTDDADYDFGKSLGQTNMNFDLIETGGSIVTTEQFNIRKAVMGASNVLTITTDIPFAGFNISDFMTNVGVSLISEAGAAPKSNEGFYFNGIRNSSVSSVNDLNGNAVVQFSIEPNIDGPILNSSNLLVEGSKYHGKISMLKSRNYSNSASAAEYSEEKAHTGVRSMKISGNSSFDQPKLKMINGKKYIFSTWVSREDIDVPTYENTTSLIDFTGSQGVTVGDFMYSKIIEGWQKIDVEIEATASNGTLRVGFVPGASPIFIDDIRFSPKTGGITTYVYDPSRFWLRASLNVDNYATLFFYDEEGNLTIKKQETEEGIYTITESRGHVSEE